MPLSCSSCLRYSAKTSKRRMRFAGFEGMRWLSVNRSRADLPKLVAAWNGFAGMTTWRNQSQARRAALAHASRVAYRVAAVRRELPRTVADRRGRLKRLLDGKTSGAVRRRVRRRD